MVILQIGNLPIRPKVGFPRAEKEITSLIMIMD